MTSDALQSSLINGEIYVTASKNMAGKTPLLMLMGYSGTVDSWTDEVLTGIASEWPIIVIDLPGNGRAAKAIEKDRLSYASTVKDIAAVLDHFKVNAAHILGYSYGGTIAMNAARALPERVSSLILVATTLGGESYVPPPREVLVALGAPPGDTLEEKTESIWRICLGADKLPRFMNAMSQAVERQKDSLTPGWVLREQLKNYLAFTFAEAAKTMQLPVTVLTGSEDPLTPPANSSAIAAAFPHASLVVIEGCRHMPHVEEPVCFVDAVLTALSSGGRV